MRHRKKGRKLNRTASHRKALLRNIANQLIEHKEIKTTTAKAKEARSTVERLITYAKKGDLHHRRLAFRFLRNKESIKILFDELAPAFSDRDGGYTRVLKLGRRSGDNAPVSILQFVGFEKLGDTAKTEKKKKSKRADSPAAEVQETAAASKDMVEEVPAVQEAEVVEESPAPKQEETPEKVSESAEKPDETETKEAEGTAETKEEASAPEPETKEEKAQDDAEEKSEKK